MRGWCKTGERLSRRRDACSGAAQAAEQHVATCAWRGVHLAYVRGWHATCMPSGNTVRDTGRQPGARTAAMQAHGALQAGFKASQTYRDTKVARRTFSIHRLLLCSSAADLNSLQGTLLPALAECMRGWCETGERLSRRRDACSGAAQAAEQHVATCAWRGVHLAYVRGWHATCMPSGNTVRDTGRQPGARTAAMQAHGALQAGFKASQTYRDTKVARRTFSIHRLLLCSSAADLNSLQGTLLPALAECMRGWCETGERLSRRKGSCSGAAQAAVV